MTQAERPARSAAGLFCSLLAGAAMSSIAVTVSDSAARTAEFAVKTSGDESIGRELSDLVESSEKAQPSAGDVPGLLQSVEAYRKRLHQALRSRGFYGANLVATVAGRRLDDPDLAPALEAQPDGDKISVVFTIDTGAVYRIANLDLRGAVAGTALPVLDRPKLALAPGNGADSAAILATQEQILEQIRQQGYALAEVSEREIVVDHATSEVHVTYVVETGAKARMGAVRFTGSESVASSFLQGRVPFEQGEPYTPAKVRLLSDRMTSLGVFNSVRLKPGTQLDERGELPFEVELRDRPPRTIGFGAAYETQQGFSVNAFWMHRNLFGEAESLRITGEASRIAQGPIADTGFVIRAAFRKPDWWLPGQEATAQAEAAREVFDAYRRRAVTLGVGLDRIITPELRARAGISGEYSAIERQGTTREYQLIGLPLGVTLDLSNSAVEPTSGWRILASLTPYLDTRNFSAPFAVFRTTASAYFDLLGSLGYQEVGRSVLAARASFGTIPGVRLDAIPPDKLFYAGGGGSVRGFAYQRAGPRDAFHTPLGGASLIEGSLEFRQRIGKSFGAVAFIDAGSAYTAILPDFSAAPRFGAGVGVRYYTDFGPVRVDVAVPLNRRDGDATFGVYVSLGQAF